MEKIKNPKQRVIYIQRSSDKAQADFLKVSNKHLDQAVWDLDCKGFKLWTYLVDNANNYKKEIYPIHFTRWDNLSNSSFERAWKDLKDKGYIIQSKDYDNIYIFQETSNTFQDRYNKWLEQQKKDLIKTVDKKEFDQIKEQCFKE